MSDSMHSDACDVYLCCAPIQNRNSASANALSYFASSSRSVCGDSWEKHWLVIFDYGKAVVLICDADMDHAGDLTGRKYWKKRTVLKDTYSYKKYLGKRTVPEEHVEAVMRAMCDSGPYHLTKNNCQKWVKELLRRLGIETPSDERDAEAVVEEVVQPALNTGYAVALLYGAWVAAKFVLTRGRF
ncbi:hypothetical protein HPB49_003180 [Dermacentor silvarum]|uniref:Uncharacterized protein n=1 Tax=Dermacentor silvarum TaxID=543639 RepID=A0ACB8D240_DERSI|nr:uncharacterized protein LOC119444081 isoform X1 [Dermacentor silvarum]KAH7958602.1 hypothetical protein HPB49_003180 [Dermacentor silvarum]